LRFEIPWWEAGGGRPVVGGRWWEAVIDVWKKGV
jgi:hypothetical protein